MFEGWAPLSRMSVLFTQLAAAKVRTRATLTLCLMWSGSPCPRRAKKTSLWRIRVAIIRPIRWSRLSSCIGGNREGYLVVFPGGKVGFTVEKFLVQFFKGDRRLSCLNSIGKFCIVCIKTIKNLDGKILDVNWAFIIASSSTFVLMFCINSVIVWEPLIGLLS